MIDHPTDADLTNRHQREAAYWREQCEALAEALSHAQGRLLNINIALSSGGTKREAIRIADLGEDCIKHVLANFTAALIDGGEA